MCLLGFYGVFYNCSNVLLLRFFMSRLYFYGISMVFLCCFSSVSNMFKFCSYNAILFRFEFPYNVSCFYCFLWCFHDASILILLSVSCIPSVLLLRFNSASRLLRVCFYPVSILFLWRFYAVSMLFLLGFYYVPIMLLWRFHGACSLLLLCLFYVSILFLWRCYGVSMLFLSCFDYVPIMFLWRVHGASICFLTFLLCF